jgi:hypothetical protein
MVGHSAIVVAVVRLNRAGIVIEAIIGRVSKRVETAIARSVGAI